MAKSTAKSLNTEKLAKLLKPLSEADETKNSPAEALTKAGINSPLLLIGEEKLRVKRLVSWIHENIFGGPENSSLEIYFGSELSSQKAVDPLIVACNNLSLFSKNQLIIIYEADKVKAAFSKTLVPYLEKNTQAFVILCGDKINQQTPLLKNLSAVGCKVDIANLDERKLAAWIRKEAKLVGASGGIAPSVVKKLADAYGSDLISISSELAKLALLTGDDQEINEQIASSISLKTPEKTTFELISSIADKNLVKAQVWTKDLIAGGFHPLQLLSLLSRAYRTMLAAKLAGTNIDSAITTPWFAKKLARDGRKFTDPELEKAIERLSELDRTLKDSSGVEEFLLLNCIGHLCRRS